MKENIEIEYKTLVNKDSFYKLLNIYKSDNNHFIKQDNFYYDTKLFDCRKKNIAIRTRFIDEVCYFTLKHKVDVLYEYEKKIANDFLSDQEVLNILLRFNINPSTLVNFASLSTKRCQINLDNAYLCFDISTYNDTVDYEIEYEYKDASASLYDFKSILSKANITYSSNCDSKIARASKYLKIQ